MSVAPQRRILVTGASGFVGSHLMPRIIAAFPSARVLALGGPHEALGVHAAMHVDLASQEETSRAVSTFAPTDVIHLAAQSSVATSLGDPTQVWAVNLLSALNLARALRAANFSGIFINASSSEVYGAAFAAGAPVTESTPAQPASPYARSKLSAELLLSDILGQHANLVTLRLFNHSGPGQDERFVLPAFAAQIARIEAGKQPPVMKVGDLSAEREFLDIDDVVAAYLLVLAAPSGSATYNVGSGQPAPIRSYLDALLAQAKTPISVEIDSARLRPSAFARASGDSSAFRRAYGWRPNTDVRALLARILEHWRGRVQNEG